MNSKEWPVERAAIFPEKRRLVCIRGQESLECAFQSFLQSEDQMLWNRALCLGIRESHTGFGTSCFTFRLCDFSQVRLESMVTWQHYCNSMENPSGCSSIPSSISWKRTAQGKLLHRIDYVERVKLRRIIRRIIEIVQMTVEHYENISSSLYPLCVGSFWNVKLKSHGH